MKSKQSSELPYECASEDSLLATQSFMSEIFSYVADNGGLPLWEGVSSPGQLDCLMKLAAEENVRRVIEIGFHLGFSSYALLAASPAITVVSFDLNTSPCVAIAKDFLDKRFPGRHELICGNSVETVPAYAERNSTLPFDMAFIDGGHEYEVTKADIINCSRICRRNALAVVDDLTPWFGWGMGPTQAWSELIGEQLIAPEAIYRDGVPVESIQGPGDRVWAIGRYRAKAAAA